MDQTLLEVARVMARRGTCSRQRNGAVVAREGRVLSTGFNGAPSGMPHCVHPPDEPRSRGCTYAVHAEANAVAFAAKHGVALRGATLYVTTTPCVACAQLTISVGITRVVAGQAYRLPDGVNLLREARIIVVYLDPVTGTVDSTPND